ncbi:MAG: hypothetical protein ACREC1_05445 [Methylovirgula sp.]
MRVSTWKFGLRAVAAAAFAVLAIQGADARFGGPFAPLAGIWLGSGTLTMPGGAQERIRCRATYLVALRGDALRQRLLCASDSYQVDLQSDVIEQGGEVSGNWTETTLGASGILRGVVRGPVIRGVISGSGLTAYLLLITRGRTQSVSIQLQGSDFAGVFVIFHKE